METRDRTTADWWGRILGLLGLVTGVGAFGLIYHQGQIAGTRDQLQRDFQAQLEQQREEYNQALVRQSEEFNVAWDKQLSEALARFEEDAREAAAAEETSQAARDSEFRRHLQSQGEQLASLFENGYETWQTKLAAPRLRLASQVLKPLTERDAGSVMIKNDGSQEAQISKIIFQPESDFQVSQPQETTSNVASANQIPIEFEAQHNQSKKQDRHGRYEIAFDESVIIPGHSYASLQIVIRNPIHKGWGLEGELTIKYDDDQTLVVPGARVFFEAAREEEESGDISA